MVVAIRLVGLLLALLAVANLVALLVIEPGQLVSPVAVAVRYTLLLLAGTGLLLASRWGVVVYLVALAFNWTAFFTVYAGHLPVTPLWQTVPVPAVVLILSALAWRRMSWWPVRAAQEAP